MQKGFTLIELLLVIAIMSLISALSVAFYARFITQNAVANAQDQLVGDFRKAQIYAMEGKLNSNWGVNFTSNTIVLYQGSSYVGRTAALDENFSVNSNISMTNMGDINYARVTGIPTNGGAAITTLTITISGPNNISKTVTIISQGTVSK
ncbi:prepilin-type N-terminal cleavage/methylation domain-containing protein [Candidatus Daviesbacteria bacterium]|nr:prepilin-type N-terminal cleavage/methylation domain-containing protein [Candidatus Daviesbacteria bacterium]